MLKKINPEKSELVGQIVEHFVESPLLIANRAGIDAKRQVTVYLPPPAKVGQVNRFPVVYLLAPWTSAGRMQFAWQSLREPLFDQINRLICEDKMPPCVMVCPDLYTFFGGSQYIDSDYLGLHASFIVKELIPYVEKHFPVLQGRQHRGVLGRSSGGYGALRLAMDFPEAFSAVACHSGDLGFETAMRRDLLDICKVLARYEGDSLAFLEHCQNARKLSGQEVHVLMLHGMAASYSPNPHSPLGFDLPINWYSGQLIEDVWQRWLQHDPVVRIQTHEALSALKRLKSIYLDCGTRDQFNLLYGCRQFSAAMREYDINHDYYEFNDNHSGTAYRYDASLLPMVEVLI